MSEGETALRINLHNHTTYSDGLLSVEEVVQAAVSARLSHVGIADHLQSEKLGGAGISRANIESYLTDIRGAAKKAASAIQVLAGIEVDFCKKRTDFELLQDGAIFEGLDFVLFEYVNNPDFEGESLDLFVGVREKIRCPVGLAHPQIELTFAGLLPDAAAGLMAEKKVFVELCPSLRNACYVALPVEADESGVEERIRGFQKKIDAMAKRTGQDCGDKSYLRQAIEALRRMDALRMGQDLKPSYRVDSEFTRSFFKGVKKYGTMISIGSDTHELADEVAEIDDALEFVREHHLEDNLVIKKLWKGR